MSVDLFHPAVAGWFRRAFAAPTEAQSLAWTALRGGQHTLVAAPTGSGKTLAAFLTALDSLVRQSVEGRLTDGTQVLYISPLKALSNDIQRNLQVPLAGIRAGLREMGAPDADIRAWVRTGDTSQAERAQMRRRPPHIVITTPESLYILLGAESGRRMLSTVQTVIVDEIHALAGNKRGAHLSLSLERLEALVAGPERAAAGERSGRLVRIGLSATQKPIEETARFLIGADRPLENCAIVDAGHIRARDLAIEVPPSPLEAVMSTDVWQQVYDRLATLIRAHRTTVVFVNTRRLAERATRHLVERLGAGEVAAHHGSLARAQRFDAEQRLKSGRLRAIVATASLELGIDIGNVDLVCQIGSPRSIAVFLQRAGRSGHAVGATPRARLFPLSRDELVECAALLDAVRRGELDRLRGIEQPLDVLAQQIVAEVAMQEWDERKLFELCRRAYPYRALDADTCAAVVRMVAEGYHTRRGQMRQYLHRDSVHGRLRARRGARLAAVTSGGAIPDNADYDVVLAPADTVIGSLNEDFAIESLAGDVFQLGNAAYRILRVEAGRVRVEDAQGQTPNVPFWLGEAPGRTDELSQAVSRLRHEIDQRADAALPWLTGELGLPEPAARDIADYMAAARAALGVLPTQDTIVFERFFDESGGMQLVIHSPFGSRINRAWGLALRKRFCRKFDFELQAAATENSIVLSLSTSHSFPLDEVAGYLQPGNVEQVLIQALLAAPMFTVRWRWNAAIALAIPRYRGGRKVPARLQRMYAEDLIADIFPDQIACAENLPGEREIPDHPLVAQTIHDCLHEAMDLHGLQALLQRIEQGEVRIVARDVVEPSPFALEVLAARPYAFLDDAPLEERRTQAVAARRWLDPAAASDLGRLDEAAIERVRGEAFPAAETTDELHDALLWFGLITVDEMTAHAPWQDLATQLAATGRATRFRATGVAGWIATERLPQLAAVFPLRALDPIVTPPAEFAARAWDPDEALVELLRGQLEGLGPVSAQGLATRLGLTQARIDSALAQLEATGFVLRGSFTSAREEGTVEWCERRLLARIHRYTVQRLRAEIEPVSPSDFMRFLTRWQHAAPADRKEGPDALAGLLSQLEGFEAPAAAWETEILPARLAHYDMRWLDDLCLSGRAAWARWSSPATGDEADSQARRAAPIRTTPIALVPRRQLVFWNTICPAPASTPPLDARAGKVLDYLAAHGASFFDEVAAGARLLGVELEDALGQLVALGLVSSDSFAGLRALLMPNSGRGRSRLRARAAGLDSAGRWSVVRRPAAGAADGDATEYVARVLLRRYGIVFWRLLAREAPWLPPWRDLLRVYRRLEARGEIRGGRFVTGLPGEQFALPEAVSALRAVRREPADGALVSFSGADPLNLVGVVIPGPRVSALTGNRVLLRDGVAVATLTAGAEQWLHPVAPAEAAAARRALIVLPQSRRDEGVAEGGGVPQREDAIARPLAATARRR
jgi:ATP-dependent Lhr-like helicase